MTDTIIVSGGDIQRDFALSFLREKINAVGREKICLIAADRGLEFFIENQMLPDVAVGDFDSLSENGRKFLEKYGNENPKEGLDKVSDEDLKEWMHGKESLKKIEVVRLRPEKDDSDTQSAMNLAIERGAKEIVILGATGKRVDHLIANFGLLVLARQKDASVSLVDAYNHMALIESGTVLKKAEKFGKYVSFFALGTDVCGLTLEGFKYPLDHYHLTVADSGLTVSNEFRDDTAMVTYESGDLMMIMSRD